jgi:Na+/proline symporter/signal transduction histidine kinase
MNSALLIIAALLYLCLLFAIANYAERRGASGKSIINNGIVYALSMGVYCTAWTYYGSVGRASTHGIEFLAIYIGPSLGALLFWPVLRKIIRISRTQRITGIADFISIRYGKNFSLAVVVALMCVIGIIPYIALQLKAISQSMALIIQQGQHPAVGSVNNYIIYITATLGLFILLFGTRSIDASEKHEGMVAAIAFESIVKLIAFLLVGMFITFFVFSGFNDVFEKLPKSSAELFSIPDFHSATSWVGLMLLSMLAVFLLPRQFQVNVVENIQESHLRKASWLFPLYLFIINLFVLPIALGGMYYFNGTGMDADNFVLAFPLAKGSQWLTLITFIGGFSAATSMIIVETIALSTMVCNNMVLPLMLSIRNFKTDPDAGLQKLILRIRRISILVILMLAILFDRFVSHGFSLVSIGLVSFVAVAQFAPAVFMGIFWKELNKNGVLAGLIAGFMVWFYTAIIPYMAGSSTIASNIVTNGPGGIGWLKPTALFGFSGFDLITHCFFWSLLLNLLISWGVSVFTQASDAEKLQAEYFVDVYRHTQSNTTDTIWKGTTRNNDLQNLLSNFLGKERSAKILSRYAGRHKIRLDTETADARMVSYSERVLSGVIGSASAHIMIHNISQPQNIRIDEVINILRESQQILELNRELTKKTNELARATEALRKLNEQLKDIDELKNEFLYTVTHELRTPLTSIRAMSEIVYDNPDMEPDDKQQFIGNVIRETERLSHLITQVLNLEKYESGRQKLKKGSHDMQEVIREVIQSVQPLAADKKIRIETRMIDSMLLANFDRDLMVQVLYNLFSNAIKFTNDQLVIQTRINYDELQVWVMDNGPGIDPGMRELIFDKFFQARNQTLQKPQGSGLGLAICKRIIEMHDGKIWVETDPVFATKFIFTLPMHLHG